MARGPAFPRSSPRPSGKSFPSASRPASVSRHPRALPVSLSGPHPGCQLQPRGLCVRKAEDGPVHVIILQLPEEVFV
ncbi:hypothetical protein DPEC_G00150650 [Dallia pectoralis]|uniref:Uncharacterized protein n=1 Tax=Dallia pectoralis TaxID=75939 RepID=A0ACC2GJ24_DALPE|nr:hypothetical protein DPEC_G00150650 [Dallia pectoralis]